MATSDINSFGSSDTSTAVTSPYGVGDYAVSGVPTSVDPTSLTTSPTNVSLTDPVPTDLGGLGTNSVPNLSDPTNNAALPQTGASTASTSTSGDWTSILSGLGSILTSPLGSAATLLGLGEYEASQAQSQTAGLTSQLTGPAQPFVQGGVSELQQTQQGLSGQPVTTGSIGQQETAAKNLGDIATEYSTGQLTPAQTAQIQQQSQAQKQNIRQQLANQGITDSSVIAMYDQQIDDNATQQTQALIQGNTTMAQGALTTVQQTYSNLLNQSISQFGAGMGPIEDAVNLTVQSNTAIANGLQSLFGQIAKGFSSASGTTGTGTAGAAGSIGSGINGVLGAIKNLFGGTSGATESLAQAGIQTDSTGAVLGANDLSTLDTESSELLGDTTDSGLSSFGSLFGPSAAGGEAAGMQALTAADLADPVPADLGGLATTGAVDLSTSSAAAGASSGLGSAIPIAGAALSFYNEIEGWQSGDTGSDALAGAETGAAVGTAVVPGIGTAVGAVIGGAGGALSSLFGGGKTDPESLSLKNVTSSYGTAYAEDPAQAQAALAEMSPAQSFQMLAGAFDAGNPTAGHSQPIVQAFGRMQEGEFVNQMADQINSAVTSGAISSNTPPAQVYSQVVEPWINSKTNGQGILGGENGEGGVLTGSIQNLIGAYMGGQLTAATPIGVSGQIDTGLPMFA